MLDPYENILIGNFLYSLGARTALRCNALGLEVKTCVSLLQQTPLDGPVGDVCIRYPGTMRILEFKRHANPSSKEHQKLEKLRVALKGREYQGLDLLSRRVHWYVESIQDSPVWRTSARPYLDLDKAATHDADIGKLTDDFACAAVGTKAPEFSASDIARYLDALATFGGVSGASSSGILVTVDHTGTVRWVALENVLDLRLTLSQRKSNTRQQVAEMGAGRERAFESERQAVVRAVRGRQLKLERDRGNER